MDDLRVIGVENGALLVSADDGERFRVPVDEMLQSKLRHTPAEPFAGERVSPKEIQSQIRAGMSAQDVASLTGMPVDHIRKYEGPVLAEREHVVLTALDVPVHTAVELDPLNAGMTFGSAIRARLHVIGGIGERWASWKDPIDGWIVKLSFTTEQIDHDARWRFDPKKLSLAPLNSEATTLSQQGDVPTALIPRLRAVASEDSNNAVEREPDSSRFDSGAFVLDDMQQTLITTPIESASRFAPMPSTKSDDSSPNHTADLLDALRRRRGERESATYAEDEGPAAHPSNRAPMTGGIRLVDVPLDEYYEDTAEQRRTTAPQPLIPVIKSARKGRAAMPSWDDIVFGARPDDPA